MARAIFLGLYDVVMRRSATRETASRIDGMTTERPAKQISPFGCYDISTN
jgi:hypothetical protein